MSDTFPSLLTRLAHLHSSLSPLPVYPYLYFVHPHPFLFYHNLRIQQVTSHRLLRYKSISSAFSILLLHNFIFITYSVLIIFLSYRKYLVTLRRESFSYVKAFPIKIRKKRFASLDHIPISHIEITCIPRIRNRSWLI